MTGKTLNKFTIIKRIDNTKHGTARWLCLCGYCKKECIKTSSQLLGKSIKSCGCMKEELHNINIKKYNDYSIVDDIVIVNLSNSNKIFTCDVYDWELRKQYCWAFHHSGYAYTTIKSKYIAFHDSLFEYDKNINQIDHINSNKLDNCRVNLRLVTKSQNMMNRGIVSNNTSGHTGVHYNKRSEMWIARIGVNYERILLGSYVNIEDAIAARIKAEIEYFGEYRFKHQYAEIIS